MRGLTFPVSFRHNTGNTLCCSADRKQHLIEILAETTVIYVVYYSACFSLKVHYTRLYIFNLPARNTTFPVDVKKYTVYNLYFNYMYLYVLRI